MGRHVVVLLGQYWFFKHCLGASYYLLPSLILLCTILSGRNLLRKV